MSNGSTTSQQLQQHLMAFVRGFGLHQPNVTPCGQSIAVGEAYILFELSQVAQLPQSDLVVKLRLAKSTVSRMLNIMQKRGWLRREKHSKDQRAWVWSLTPDGERLASQIAIAREQKFLHLLSKIPEAEIPAVLSALQTLVTATKVEEVN